MSDDIQNDDVQNDIDPEVLKEAKELGWLPKEKFKGRETDWVDADSFVEKSRHVLPIVQQHNARLKKELLTATTKIDTLEKRLAASDTAIERLETHWSEANKRAVEQTKITLLAELKEARESGDVNAEDAIQGKLDEVREAQRNADKKPEKKDEPAKKDDYREALDPATKTFMDENPWYGVDKKKTKEITRLAEDLREEGNVEKGDDFYKTLLEEYESRYGEDEEEKETPRRSSKVEGGNHRGNNSGNKSFNSLPKEARDACHADAEALVGEGKRYKDLKSWQEAYAKIYFSAE